MGGCDQIGKNNQRRSKKLYLPTSEEEATTMRELTEGLLSSSLGRNPIEIRRRRNCVDDVEDKMGILGFNFMLFDFLI